MYSRVLFLINTILYSNTENHQLQNCCLFGVKDQEQPLLLILRIVLQTSILVYLCSIPPQKATGRVKTNTLLSDRLSHVLLILRVKFS